MKILSVMNLDFITNFALWADDLNLPYFNNHHMVTKSKRSKMPEKQLWFLVPFLLHLKINKPVLLTGHWYFFPKRFGTILAKRLQVLRFYCLEQTNTT